MCRLLRVSQAREHRISLQTAAPTDHSSPGQGFPIIKYVLFVRRVFLSATMSRLFFLPPQLIWFVLVDCPRELCHHAITVCVCGCACVCHSGCCR